MFYFEGETSNYFIFTAHRLCLTTETPAGGDRPLGLPSKDYLQIQVISHHLFIYNIVNRHVKRIIIVIVHDSTNGKEKKKGVSAVV